MEVSPVEGIGSPSDESFGSASESTGSPKNRYDGMHHFDQSVQLDQELGEVINETVDKISALATALKEKSGKITVGDRLRIIQEGVEFFHKRMYEEFDGTPVENLAQILDENVSTEFSNPHCLEGRVEKIFRELGLTR